MTTNERADYTAFVPAGENRRETARALVDLANANGIAQTSIQSTHGGFNVTDEVADLLYAEVDDTEADDTEAADPHTDSVSGNPDTAPTAKAPAKTAPTKKRK